MDFTLLLIIITFLTGIIAFVGTIKSSQGILFEILSFAKSIFPILFIVLIIRSFIFEPYRIPSGSMIPTLVVGDFILVKKYHYGLRIPITNNIIVENNKPNYGDVIVFQYPLDKKISYIKRVIALPGDKIDYLDKVVYVNDKKYSNTNITPSMISLEDLGDNIIATENNGTQTYNILKNKNIGQNFTYIVPNETYFVLGDNRDNSNDSRYWGPVPESNIVGKAFMIWMFWNPESDYSISDRIGKSIN